MSQYHVLFVSVLLLFVEREMGIVTFGTISFFHGQEFRQPNQYHKCEINHHDDHLIDNIRLLTNYSIIIERKLNLDAARTKFGFPYRRAVKS